MNVLIIEDSNSTGKILSSILESRNFRTKICRSLDIDYSDIKENKYSFILMNINLEIDSISILKNIKKQNIKLVVIGISSKGTRKEKVEFLNHKANDVIEYPFPIEELMARINRFMRKDEDEESIIRLRNIELDTGNKSVKINNKEVKLRRKEYELLEYMIKNPNRSISRIELLDHVWDYRRITGSNTIDVHVKRLRDKLPKRGYIKTLHGFGYKINK